MGELNFDTPEGRLLRTAIYLLSLNNPFFQGRTKEEAAIRLSHISEMARIGESRARKLPAPAAPELLDALKITRGQWIHSVNAEKCLAAIAKAEGK